MPPLPPRIALLAVLLLALAGCATLAPPSGASPTAQPPATPADASGVATPAPASPATPVADRPVFPASSHMAKIVQRGKVIIGVKYDTPPFGNLDPVTNKVVGFDIDIGKELAKALFGPNAKLEGPDANVEWIEAISRNRIPFLQEDKVDLIISTMTIDDERRQLIDFSDVYYMAGQGLLVKKGSSVKGIADTVGKTVCSAQGSTSEQNIRAKQPQARLLLHGNYSLCLLDLADGRADAISTDDTILMGMVAKDANLQLVGGLFTEEPYGIGIKRGRPDFVKFVNDTLAAMKKDGRWKAIYRANLAPLTGLDPEPPK